MARIVKPVTRLEAVRRSALLSRRKLAAASKVDYDTICDIEHHKRKNGPTYPTLLALATALGCSVEDITGNANG